MSATPAKTNVTREVIAHICTGITVLLKGIDKVENPDKLIFGAILIFIGSIILSVGVFHNTIEHKIKNIKSIVFLGEAIVMAIVGYIYYHDHKFLIQYACFIASIGFLIAFVKSLLKYRK